jgi:hypothetical protein
MGKAKSTKVNKSEPTVYGPGEEVDQFKSLPSLLAIQDDSHIELPQLLQTMYLRRPQILKKIQQQIVLNPNNKKHLDSGKLKALLRAMTMLDLHPGCSIKRASFEVTSYILSQLFKNIVGTFSTTSLLNQQDDNLAYIQYAVQVYTILFTIYRRHWSNSMDFSPFARDVAIHLMVSCPVPEGKDDEAKVKLVEAVQPLLEFLFQNMDVDDFKHMFSGQHNPRFSRLTIPLRATTCITTCTRVLRKRGGEFAQLLTSDKDVVAGLVEHYAGAWGVHQLHVTSLPYKLAKLWRTSEFVHDYLVSIRAFVLIDSLTLADIVSELKKLQK